MRNSPPAKQLVGVGILLQQVQKVSITKQIRKLIEACISCMGNGWTGLTSLQASDDINFGIADELFPLLPINALIEVALTLGCKY